MSHSPVKISAGLLIFWIPGHLRVTIIFIIRWTRNVEACRRIYPRIYLKVYVLYQLLILLAKSYLSMTIYGHSLVCFDISPTLVDNTSLICKSRSHEYMSSIYVNTINISVFLLNTFDKVSVVLSPRSK